MILLAIKSFLNSFATPFIIVLLVLVFAIVIPNMDKLKESLGFDTVNSLQVKLEKSRETNDALVQSLEEQQINLDKLSQTKDQVIEIFNKQVEYKDLVANKTETIVQQKTAKIRKVKQTKDKTTNINKTVSQIQITSIWQTYCQFNTSPECSAYNS